GADWATSTAFFGPFPLSVYAGYASSLVGASATTNVKITTTNTEVVPVGGVTVNSLIISGSGLNAVTGSGSGNALTTSTLLVTGGTDFINAPVNIGTAGT